LFVVLFASAAWALAFAAFGRLERWQRATIVLVNVLTAAGAAAWLLYRPI
jgi:hypothetical protein